MKVSGKILLFILISSGFAGPRCGAAVCHSDGSAASVQACHNSASEGDTITIPAGTFTWSAHVTIRKGITIQGQTTVNSDTGVCNDQTVLLDNLNPNYLGGEGYFHCRVNTGQALRITGLTFKAGTTTTKYNGAIRVGGNSNQVRLDHLHFTNLYHTNYIAIYGTVRGVSDHVVEDHIPGQLGQQKVSNGAGPGGYGDEVWSQPAGYGGPDFFFFEDWYCDNSTGAPFSANGGWDANTGGKFVIRHCHLYNIEILCHGTEGSRARGGRAQEIYNNDYHWSYFTGMDGIRSGTLIAHDNTFVGLEPRGWNQQTYRMIFGYGGSGPFAGWKGATGASAWDLNDPVGLFDSGTVTGWTNTGQFGTLTDSAKTWTVNQWAGYEVSNPANGDNFLIDSNTANTLTTRQWGDPCCIQNFTAGNTYQIRRVLQCLDQPGSGASDLISGDNPTPTWLHQVREGSYSWNNIHTASGHHINFTSSTPNLLPGRDYFQDTPLPGYTPHTYPHPLVSGVEGAFTDFVLYNASTQQTVIWYMHNNIRVSGSYGPTLPAGWSIVSVADFNRDGHPDYLLLNSTTLQTVIWYLSGVTHTSGNYGPTLPSGWELVATADFNGDGYPDLVLYNASTQQTVIWYMHNNIHVSGHYGPTLPTGWSLVAVADFDGRGHPDYLLFNPITGASVIWYLSGTTHTGGRYGPTVPAGFNLLGVADLNQDGKPDIVLFNPGTGQTAIWYMNNYGLIGTAFGPALPAGWSLVAP